MQLCLIAPMSPAVRQQLFAGAFPIYFHSLNRVCLPQPFQPAGQGLTRHAATGARHPPPQLMKMSPGAPFASNGVPSSMGS